MPDFKNNYNNGCKTVPNQRVVKIHREPAQSNFLGIKNDNWMAAARDLRPHALLLYLYFASNANNYEFGLSPAAIRQAVGMPSSTYSDQFKVLIDKGYLVQSSGNRYDFYEVPHPSDASNYVKSTSLVFNDEENSTEAEQGVSVAANSSSPEDIEINNINRVKNNNINTSDYRPKVETITIAPPKANTKERKKLTELHELASKQSEFVF